MRRTPEPTGYQRDTNGICTETRWLPKWQYRRVNYRSFAIAPQAYLAHTALRRFSAKWTKKPFKKDIRILIEFFDRLFDNFGFILDPLGVHLGHFCL